MKPRIEKEVNIKKKLLIIKIRLLGAAGDE